MAVMVLVQIRAELAEKELILLEKEKELLEKEQTLLVLKEEVSARRGLVVGWGCHRCNQAAGSRGFWFDEATVHESLCKTWLLGGATPAGCRQAQAQAATAAVAAAGRATSMHFTPRIT